MSDREMSHSDSDDDPVVEEYDLYINGSADPNELHIVQYPLRHSDRPYGDQGKLLKVEVAYDSDKKFGGQPNQSSDIFDKGAFDAPQNKPISNFRFRYQLEPTN